MRRTAAFTLVELLVAVALLSVLVGVLLPMLSHYRHEAHRTACAEQLGRAMMGIASYEAAHDRLPVARPIPKPIDGPDALPALPMTIGRYIGRAAFVFHCPGDGLTLFPLCGSSYYYDTSVAVHHRRGGDGSPVVLPGGTPLLWDCDNVVLRARGETLEIPPFHGDRTIAYLDGHVADAPAPLPPPFGR